MEAVHRSSLPIYFADDSKIAHTEFVRAKLLCNASVYLAQPGLCFTSTFAVLASSAGFAGAILLGEVSEGASTAPSD